VKFKMSPNSLFAILLRSPWWVSFALVGAFSLAAAALLPRDYVLVGLLGTFPFFAVGCVSAWRQWRAPSAARMAAAHAQIQSLPWRGFADELEATWRTGGQGVERLAAGAAADFVLTKGGQVQLASARRWKAANHGVEPLRELHTAMQARGAKTGLYLVAQGGLSDNARLFARDHGITVVQGNALALLLLGAG
jgi:restriction system protein